jgi:hypothetical protein
MTEQHVSIEDLAAYAAGDLDATAAVAVEAHVLLCAECRSDVDAVSAAATALAAVERPVMPEDVAARLDAALAAEDDDAHPVVVPMSTRRRPSFAGIAAVAAGVALVGAMAVPLLRSEGTRDGASTAALDSAEKGATGGTGAAVESRRLDSNLEYTHDNLASTLASALKGAAFRPPGPAPTAMPSAAGAAAPRGADDVRRGPGAGRQRHGGDVRPAAAPDRARQVRRVPEHADRRLPRAGADAGRRGLRAVLGWPGDRAGVPHGAAGRRARRQARRLRRRPRLRQRA